MIVKIVRELSGTCKTRIIECSECEFQRRKEIDNAVAMVCQQGEGKHVEIHLNDGDSVDHVYIMDRGQTVDHITFYPDGPSKE